MTQQPGTTPGGVLIEHIGDIAVIVVRGHVDRELARRIDGFLQRQVIEGDGRATIIDVTHVDAVNGALLGTLLRASRRLAWRNLRLEIVCGDPELWRALEIAGLDELATLTAVAYRPRPPG